TSLGLITLGYAVYFTSMMWISSFEIGERQICPSRLICAKTTFNMIILTISRFTGGLIVPSTIITALSKANNSRAWVQHSSVGTVVDFEPTHDLHTFYGNVFIWSSVIHSVTHIVRFIVQDAAIASVDNTTSRSGLFAFILFVVSVLPMSSPFIKKKLYYEVRKALHYLTLPAMAAMCFHTVLLAILMAILIAILVGDMAYFHLKGTHLVES
ncbi:unnamed protein product, partial [Choristocarpus tenellus]